MHPGRQQHMDQSASNVNECALLQHESVPEIGEIPSVREHDVYAIDHSGMTVDITGDLVEVLEV